MQDSDEPAIRLERCCRCRHFDGEGPRDRTGAQKGLCRVKPPTIYGGSELGKSGWPWVISSDWCGAFDATDAYRAEKMNASLQEYIDGMKA